MAWGTVACQVAAMYVVYAMITMRACDHLECFYQISAIRAVSACTCLLARLTISTRSTPSAQRRSTSPVRTGIPVYQNALYLELRYTVIDGAVDCTH